MESIIKKQLLSILDEETEIAQGCTEPIAGAYTSAVAKRILAGEVTKVEVTASKNIIKNAKGVIIPNTSDLMGIEAAVILGYLIGDAKLKMEVLNNIDELAIAETKAILDSGIVELRQSDSKAKLMMNVRLYSGDEWAEAAIMHMHTNVVKIVKNGMVLQNKACDENDFNSDLTTKENLTLANIRALADDYSLEIPDVIKKQIEYNSAISQAGFEGVWGAGVGRINKLETEREGLAFDIRRSACVSAASGSDARMSGCPLPVVTVNGSGNQGMTIVLPILEFAKYQNIETDKLERSVLFADLTAIRIKQTTGRLSSLCGATFAAIGSVAGILYMLDYPQPVIEKMIKNTISNNTGVICDGAKASCALKIYSGLDTALLSAQLAINGSVIPDGTGIIKPDIEQTIDGLKLISDAMTNVDTAVMQILMGTGNK